MMKNYKFCTHLLMLLYFFLIINQSNAQDPILTQGFAHNMLQNPAMAGSKEVARVAMDNRWQWVTAMSKVQTSEVHTDLSLGRVGFGMSAQMDQEGIYFKASNIGTSLSYKIGNARKFIFQPGIQVSYLNRSLNNKELIFRDQLDPNDGLVSETSQAGSDFQNVNALDFSAGFFTHFPVEIHRTQPAWMNLGMAVFHIPKHDFSHIGIVSDIYPRRYVFHSGFLVPLYLKNDTSKLHRQTPWYLYPNVKYERHGFYNFIEIGSIAWRKYFMGGITYRTFPKFYDFKNAQQLAFMVGTDLKLGNFLATQISYSLDWTFSGITKKIPTKFITHEVSILIFFGIKKKGDCSDKLEYAGKWFDPQRSQRRYRGECPPGYSPRNNPKSMSPLFYPFMLPQYDPNIY